MGSGHNPWAEIFLSRSPLSEIRAYDHFVKLGLNPRNWGSHSDQKSENMVTKVSKANLSKLVGTPVISFSVISLISL